MRRRIDSIARAWRQAAHNGAHHRPKEVAARVREVEDDRGDGPNGLVWPNGPAWQLGWRRVSGQIQGFE
jgi:hypothetical protein